MVYMEKRDKMYCAMPIVSNDDGDNDGNGDDECISDDYGDGGGVITCWNTPPPPNLDDDKKQTAGTNNMPCLVMFVTAVCFLFSMMMMFSRRDTQPVDGKYPMNIASRFLSLYKLHGISSLSTFKPLQVSFLLSLAMSNFLYAHFKMAATNCRRLGTTRQVESSTGLFRSKISTCKFCLSFVCVDK